MGNKSSKFLLYFFLGILTLSFFLIPTGVQALTFGPVCKDIGGIQYCVGMTGFCGVHWASFQNTGININPDSDPGCSVTYPSGTYSGIPPGTYTNTISCNISGQNLSVSGSCNVLPGNMSVKIKSSTSIDYWKLSTTEVSGYGGYNAILDQSYPFFWSYGELPLLIPNNGTAAGQLEISDTFKNAGCPGPPNPVFTNCKYFPSYFANECSPPTGDPTCRVQSSDYECWNYEMQKYSKIGSCNIDCGTYKIWAGVSGPSDSDYDDQNVEVTGCSPLPPPPPPNNPPTATINLPLGNPSITEGDNVNFTGSGADTDGTITAYEWWQNDCAATGLLLNSSASFSKNDFSSVASPYNIYFRVQDNDGAWSGCDLRVITVNAAGCPPGPPYICTSVPTGNTCNTSNCGTNITTIQAICLDNCGTIVADSDCGAGCVDVQTACLACDDSDRYIEVPL